MERTPDAARRAERREVGATCSNASRDPSAIGDNLRDAFNPQQTHRHAKSSGNGGLGRRMPRSRTTWEAPRARSLFEGTTPERELRVFIVQCDGRLCDGIMFATGTRSVGNASTIALFDLLLRKNASISWSRLDEEPMRLFVRGALRYTKLALTTYGWTT